jgi:outer membrane protein
MKYVKIFLVVLLASLAINAQSLKIGYIDSEVILSQYPPAIKAQSDLDALVAKWRAQLDSMMADYQQELAAIQKQFQNMPPDKQQEIQQKMAQKEMMINQFQQQKFGQPNGEIYRKNQEILEPIKQKIRDAIKEVAKQEKMSFVFDSNQSIPVLLYGDEKYDITFKVLDWLKRGKK